MNIGDIFGYDPEYSFAGVLMAAIILVILFTCLTVFWIVPKMKKRAKGFNVSGQISKLDKNKFKVIKKMYFENIRNNRFVSNVIIGNNGVFVVKAQFEKGKIFQNEKGKFVAQDNGAVHVLGDYIDENKKVFEKMKKVSNRFDGVKFYSVVVFPNSCEVSYTPDEGFFGNLKDVRAFIESQSAFKMDDAKRDDLYNMLCKEDEKNKR